jgi:hypothetical protein
MVDFSRKSRNIFFLLTSARASSLARISFQASVVMLVDLRGFAAEGTGEPCGSGETLLLLLCIQNLMINQEMRF